MGREGRMFKGVLSLMLVLVLGLAAACTSDEDGSDKGDSSDEIAIERADRPSADESAPDPIPVDIDDLETIEEWQAAGVPRFGNGDVLDFEPHASVIENGGTLLLAGDDASAEEIIGF